MYGTIEKVCGGIFLVHYGSYIWFFGQHSGKERAPWVIYCSCHSSMGLLNLLHYHVMF